MESSSSARGACDDVRNAWGIVVAGMGRKFSGSSRNERSLVGMSSSPVVDGVACLVDTGRGDAGVRFDGDIGRNDDLSSRGLVLRVR